MELAFTPSKCAEKYLKARLEEGGITFGKTHDLEKLLSLALTVEPSWSVPHQDLIFLTDFAVEYRYPGSSATKAEAEGSNQALGHRPQRNPKSIRAATLGRSLEAPTLSRALLLLAL